jgi:hypothetical protein
MAAKLKIEKVGMKLKRNLPENISSKFCSY